MSVQPVGKHRGDIARMLPNSRGRAPLQPWWQEAGGLGLCTGSGGSEAAGAVVVVIVGLQLQGSRYFWLCAVHVTGCPPYEFTVVCGKRVPLSVSHILTLSVSLSLSPSICFSV